MLANKYRDVAIKYRIFIFRKGNVKDTKWWKFFLQTAEKYYLDEDFDYDFFIEINFKTYGSIYPSFLQGKQAEKTYKENFFKEIEDYKSVLEDVKSSSQAIQLWKSRNKDKEDYFDCNILLLQNKVDYLSTFYLSCSKSFLKAYSKINEKDREYVIPKRTLSTKRALIKQYNILEEVQELMKDDFI